MLYEIINHKFVESCLKNSNAISDILKIILPKNEKIIMIKNNKFHCLSNRNNYENNNILFIKAYIFNLLNM